MRSNTFKARSPPGSGEWRTFPEVDRAGFFPLEEASIKINPGQRPLLKVEQGGKDAIITLPSSTETNPQRFRFEIKHFHRLEGVFSLSPGVVLKEVEARLLQDGVVRAKQTVNL